MCITSQRIGRLFSRRTPAISRGEQTADQLQKACNEPSAALHGYALTMVTDEIVSSVELSCHDMSTELNVRLLEQLNRSLELVQAGKPMCEPGSIYHEVENKLLATIGVLCCPMGVISIGA